jgi:hypothetical protein
VYEQAEKDRLLIANSKGEVSKDDSSEVKRLKERVKIVEEALRAMRDEVRASPHMVHPAVLVCKALSHACRVHGCHEFYLSVSITFPLNPRILGTIQGVQLNTCVQSRKG